MSQRHSLITPGQKRNLDAVFTKVRVNEANESHKPQLLDRVYRALWHAQATGEADSTAGSRQRDRQSCAPAAYRRFVHEFHRETVNGGDSTTIVTPCASSVAYCTNIW